MVSAAGNVHRETNAKAVQPKHLLGSNRSKKRNEDVAASGLGIVWKEHFWPLNSFRERPAGALPPARPVCLQAFVPKYEHKSILCTKPASVNAARISKECAFVPSNRHTWFGSPGPWCCRTWPHGVCLCTRHALPTPTRAPNRRDQDGAGRPGVLGTCHLPTPVLQGPRYAVVLPLC